MKKNNLGIFLAITVGFAMLSVIFLQTFLPRVILPRLNAPAMVLLCLIALILDFYISGNSSRNYWLIPLYGALIFGLFPLAARLVLPLNAGYLALLGGAVFTVVTFLFDTVTDRLSTGSAAKIAPLFSALGLYLAFQCLTGII